MASCSRQAMEADGESTKKPNWLELPSDVTANILHRLGAVAIVARARYVCPMWWNICKDPLMWCTIDVTDLCYSYDYMEQICRCAVYQSCGHLEDINIETFGTDDLLEYIADSACHLRRIRVANCRQITDGGWSQVAKKLPLLEELEISFCRWVAMDSVEEIGRCCPLLKALKFNIKVCRGTEKVDDEAFAIAKSMPELRHLQLLGNLLSNDGLVAILDGCPRLESLDLRACYQVDLSGSLGKRCAEQIKDLRLPNEYVDIEDDDCSYMGYSREFPYGYPDYVDDSDLDYADLL